MAYQGVVCCTWALSGGIRGGVCLDEVVEAALAKDHGVVDVHASVVLVPSGANQAKQLWLKNLEKRVYTLVDTGAQVFLTCGYPEPCKIYIYIENFYGAIKMEVPYINNIYVRNSLK